MASLEQRLQRLEESKAKTVTRTMSDVELAVRIANLKPGTPTYVAVHAIINRSRKQQAQALSPISASNPPYSSEPAKQQRNLVADQQQT